MKLITFTLSVVLIASFLLVGVTANEYDPWLDVNDDGEIDIFDVVKVAGAYGTNGTAINKTDLLLELLDRVDSNEAKLDQVKWIRFYEPNETIIPPPSVEFTDAAVFVWTPSNSTNNAILSIRCYFKYRSEPSSGGLRYRIVINGENTITYAWLHTVNYKWAPMVLDWDWGGGNRVMLLPNQSNYTITFQSACETTGYVKDINILIEVMDGLPAS